MTENRVTVRLSGYFLKQNLMKKRLYIFIFVSLCLSILMSKQLLSGVTSNSSVNFWDGLFSFVGDYQNNLLILCLFFLYSIIDILYGQDMNIFSRIQTKEQWLYSKIMTIFIHVLLITFLFYMIPIIVNAILMPIDYGWSRELQRALEGSSQFFLPHMDFAEYFTPMWALVLSFGLANVVLNVMGLVNITIYLMFSHSKVILSVLNMTYVILCYISYHYVDYSLLKYVVLYDFMVISYYFYKPYQPDLLNICLMLCILTALLFIGNRLLLRRWSIV